MKTGRPQKEINMEQVAVLAQIHCTDEEIAAVMDVSVRTILRRKKRADFQEFIATGRAKGRASLRRLMWETAKGDSKSAGTMQIWLSKNILGYTDKVLNEHTGANGKPIEIADVRSKLADLIARRSPAQPKDEAAPEAV
jgi:hypothetical protein